MAAVLFAIDFAISYKKSNFQRFKPRELIEKEVFLTTRIRNLINKNLFLKEINKKYINKLNLINNLGSEKNERSIELFILVALIVSFTVGVMLYKILTMWYVFIIIFISCMFIMLYLGVMTIDFYLNKIHSLFPLAIQLFTDEYVTYGNIKLAVNNSYTKMPGKISRTFENLARRLSSVRNEEDYKVSIDEFAKGLDFIWGYAFCEILLLSYNGIGDIREPLIMLNKLTTEEIIDDFESVSSITFSKIMFFILQFCTFIGFVLNFIYMPTAREIYLYTQVGNNGLIAWVLSFIIGIVVLSILKRT